MSRTIEYVMAQNTNVGTPQRGWIVRYYDGNGPIGVFFVNEGYEGFSALRNAGLTDLEISSGNIAVRRISLATYRTLRKELPELTTESTYIRKGGNP